MGILEAILLGIIQGITEFLPISSSGHLIIARELFGIEMTSLSFDVGLHLATLVAVVWVMRKDIVSLVREVFSKNFFSSVGFKIAVATVPAVIAGLFIADNLLGALRTTQVVAISLIFWGIVLYFADWYASKHKAEAGSLEKITWRQAIIVGIAQAIALIPGTSRSGITMTAGLFVKIDRIRVAKFSFLLSIPAILGAGILTAYDTIGTGVDVSAAAMITGCVAALISGIFAVKFLLKFLIKGSFLGFSIYRIILGSILLASLWLF